jgi:L-asparaginase II
VGTLRSVVTAVPLVRVVRSGVEESVHVGHVAVCDAKGRLVASAGDPNHRLFARSCMKPLQAAVSLDAAAEPIPDRELAVMCASHNGEPVHVGAVRAVLRRAGLGPDALRNPPGWPIDPASMARAQQKNRELHDCSGKHAGMLLACVRAGWDTETYLRRSHPLQKRILRAVLRSSGRDAVEIGVDGCGVPVHGMRLRDMATLYARLARPEMLGDLAEQADRCVEAMLAEPYLVGGRGRVDTAVMTETADVIAKSGAEALECAAVLDPGLGVAVKVADGGWRAGPPALVAALSQVGALDAEQLGRLAPFARPPVLGGGDPVGELIPELRLRRR